MLKTGKHQRADHFLNPVRTFVKWTSKKCNEMLLMSTLQNYQVMLQVFIVYKTVKDDLQKQDFAHWDLGILQTLQNENRNRNQLSKNKYFLLTLMLFCCTPSTSQCNN